MEKDAITGVYLLHFDEWVGGDGSAGALHYLGWSSDVMGRMDAHKRGRGSKLLRCIRQRGIGWRLVRVWAEADRNDERRLKNGGHFAELCPACAGDRATGRRAYGYEIITFEEDDDGQQ